jgi:hypothetical protein
LTRGRDGMWRPRGWPAPRISVLAKNAATADGWGHAAFAIPAALHANPRAGRSPHEHTADSLAQPVPVTRPEPSHAHPPPRIPSVR